MVRSSLLLAALSSSVGLTKALFSVHDDILAFPQFQVSIIVDSYVSVEEADLILSPSPKPSTASTPPLSTNSDEANPQNGGEGVVDEPQEMHEVLWWEDRRYLCSIPIVKPPPPLNATEKELHRAQEEKELARATTRGWELLNEMEGKCLYFISGWWSYSFCHNQEIKQFHQLPPQSGASMFPPEEDPATASYVLGRANPGAGVGGKSKRGDGTELQGSGELRYLVQKMGGGTICDITGKERRIEIQYHCNPSSTDRIGFVKEVSICCYLMVVYTPRLCNDVAFLPPREGRANMVQCKQIMTPAEIEEWEIKKREEDHFNQLVSKFARKLDDEEKQKELKGIDGRTTKEADDKKTGEGSGKGLKGEKRKAQTDDDEEITIGIDDSNFLGHDEL